MIKAVRRFFAPCSIVVCLSVISLLFTQLYGTTSEAPAIVNPRFKYWTPDPIWKFEKPFMWELSLLLGPYDRGLVRQDTVDGRICLGMHVFQDGANDEYHWATVHVRQNLRERATRKLFEGSLDMWVYPTFRHGRYPESGHPMNVFGVEINDGTNLLWLVFSDQPDQVYQIEHHRIVTISTPLNQWSHREVQIGKYYSDAGWKPPSEVALILLVGATKVYQGDFAGFFLEIRVK